MKIFVRRLTIVLTVLIASTFIFIMPLDVMPGNGRPGGEDDDKARNTKQVQDDKDDYYRENYLRYGDYIYKTNIKTVLLHRKGFELSAPILRMNSDEQLLLSFDDLDGDYKNYTYTLVHCDALWNPSEEIWKNDYMKGFTEGYIEDYDFSFNTVQAYTHYTLTLPNNVIQFTKSGNYILKVYLENEDNVVFTRRFMVVDNQVDIVGKITYPSTPRFRDSKHEIDFSILTKKFRIIDTERNLHVIITQNGRWDNAIRDIKPRMIQSDRLNFNYDDRRNLFNGINEFRYFDMKSLRYLSGQINEIGRDTAGYHAYLWPDENRRKKNYVFREDINGERLIKNEETRNPLEADYAHVHFFLPYKMPLIEGNLYVFGELTQWQFLPEAKMKYNFTESGYETSLYLKQGYYNYYYVFLGNGETEGDATFIEGNHFETENEYTIYVYYREPGGLYDQLIGLKQLNSRSER
ncbi:MAG: DUF5103 domain-containing protein [Bacteroidales bacterium]|nr:DUF5103 domain-containing protein [Bacteroidales bacterium]